MVDGDNVSRKTVSETILLKAMHRETIPHSKTLKNTMIEYLLENVTCIEGSVLHKSAIRTVYNPIA